MSSHFPNAPSSTEAMRLERLSPPDFNPGALRVWATEPGPPARRPMVVCLHGCGQTAKAFVEGSGWLDLAARLDVALLCPEQAVTNNSGRCFNWFEPTDIAADKGEAASILAMIDARLELGDVDPQQVFIFGLSAGAAMGLAVMTLYPDRFAAAALFAGMPVGAAEGVGDALRVMVRGPWRLRSTLAEDARKRPRIAPVRWPRLSLWHGLQDTTVAPVNALSAAAQWRDLRGLADRPDDDFQIGPRRSEIWRDAAGEIILELNLIEGLAHGAPVSTRGPDACGASGPYMPELGISSAKAAAEFFGLGAERPVIGGANDREPGSRVRGTPRRPPHLTRLLSRLFRRGRPRGAKGGTDA